MINELNSLNIVNVNTPDEISAHTTLSAASKASILIEALPYIQKFAGKTMVIKYGGNAMISEELKTKVMQDIALMKCIGIKPVIAPIGAGKGETTYNINADYVAAEVAGALQAEKLLMLTNTKGIYTSLDDPKSFLSSIPKADATAMIENGTIQGGMIPKVEAVLHALECGTHRVSIIDGREPHALLLELFTNKGIGTEII